MSSPTYKFSEFVDMILVRLYELDRQDSQRFVDLSVIQKELKEQVPTSWLIDAAKVLQSRGLAECMITYSGVFAQISGEGRLYVEDGRGYTKKIEESRSSYYNINVSGGINQIVSGSSTGSATQTVTNAKDTGPWANLIDTIESKLKNDGSLSEVEKDDALTYLNVVRGELRKQEPNQSIVAAVLQPLSHILSVASQVANLIKIFNG
jgi:hypothetical protein